MEYRGLGEFACTECGNVEYNDYGKVRNYLEEHRGATQDEVFRMTGVAKWKIREFLIEEKIEIAPDSITYLKCEKCGANIRSGRYCENCRKKIIAEEAAYDRTKPHIRSGYASDPNIPESGQRRFERKK